MLKLLDKKTIVEQKAVERRQEVEEGLKLAKKVDALRQTAANEQANLAKYRVESLKTLRSDIDGLTNTKIATQAQVTALEAKRIELLKPLDEEWAKLREEKEILHAEKESIFQQLVEIERKELLQTRIAHELSDSKERIDIERHQTHECLIKSTQTLAESQAKLSQAKAKLQKADDYYNEKRDQLLKREAKVSIREREDQLVRANLDSKENELRDWEKQINDKYETLQRSINRLKK